jgi:RNA polymerase sigma-70 factor (ECF subfamily)
MSGRSYSLNAEDAVRALLSSRPAVAFAAVRVCGDAHAAEDIYQEIVLESLRSPERFRNPDHVTAWAVQMARHRAINLMKSRQRFCLDPRVLELLEADDSPSPDDATGRIDALARCLEKLPARSREILRWRYEDGLSGAAVAARMGASLAAVYQIFSRLHHGLRACLDRQLARQT